MRMATPLMKPTSSGLLSKDHPLFSMGASISTPLSSESYVSSITDGTISAKPLRLPKKVKGRTEDGGTV